MLKLLYLLITIIIIIGIRNSNNVVKYPLFFITTFRQSNIFNCGIIFIIKNILCI